MVVKGWCGAMNSENEEVFQRIEIPSSLPPDEVLKRSTFELRHITNSLIGWVRILQESHVDEMSHEAIRTIYKITQNITEIFNALDDYLEEYSKLSEKEQQSSKKEALEVFVKEFRRLFRIVEEKSAILQRQPDALANREYEVAQIRKSVEAIEKLRLSVSNEQNDK